MIKSKFKIGDLVLYRPIRDKTGSVIAGTSGLIRQIKFIDGRSLLKNYVVYYVELENSGLEWINEKYLVKA